MGARVAQRASQREVRDHVADDRRHQVATRPAPQGEQQTGGGHRPQERRRVRQRMRRSPRHGAADDRQRRPARLVQRGIERAAERQLLRDRDDDRERTRATPG